MGAESALHLLWRACGKVLQELTWVVAHLFKTTFGLSRIPNVWLTLITIYSVEVQRTLDYKPHRSLSITSEKQYLDPSKS